jgi:hypothetical protein
MKQAPEADEGVRAQVPPGNPKEANVKDRRRSDAGRRGLASDRSGSAMPHEPW